MRHPEPPAAENPRATRRAAIAPDAEVDAAVYERCEGVFNLIDKNRNGVVSRIELFMACKHDRKVATLLQIPEKIMQEDGTFDDFEASFQLMDADDSDQVTIAEWQHFWATHVQPKMVALAAVADDPPAYKKELEQLLSTDGKKS